MSALPPKADIGTQPRNVRLVPKPAVSRRSVRFPPDDIARLRRRASQEPGRSMRHEYRDGHSSQHAAGDTAKHELAQTRVAIAPHHNEIDVLISRM